MNKIEQLYRMIHAFYIFMLTVKYINIVRGEPARWNMNETLSFQSARVLRETGLHADDIIHREF